MKVEATPELDRWVGVSAAPVLATWRYDWRSTH